MILPWRWDIEGGGAGGISIGLAQAPRHLTSISPACLIFVQATESPSRRPSPVPLSKLPWATEKAGYGGKLDVLLEACALVLYSASAVAETEGIKNLMGDLTAQWPIELVPWTGLLDARTAIRPV